MQVTINGDHDAGEKIMTSKIVSEIQVSGGEIVVYKDADGYHAERWSNRSQAVVAQSGDCKTAREAIDRVS